MKTRVLRIRLLGLVVLFLSYEAAAQVANPALSNPKYGADPATREECLKQTSFYQEFYKQGNYKDAESGWKIVYDICPQSSQNIYIRGIKMLKVKLDAMPLADTGRNALIDSLMHVYDKRIQYFGKRGYHLQQKGADLMAYAPERDAEISEILKEAYSLQKDELDAATVLKLFENEVRMYGEKKRTSDDIIGLYADLSATLKRQEEKDSTVRPMADALDQRFASLGVATCADLEGIYGPKFESAPQDVDLAKTVYNHLGSLRCYESALYLRAAKLLFKSVPSAGLALEIARICMGKRDNEGAEEYFKQSISLELDGNRKGRVLLEYANFVSTALGNKPQARSLAYEAVSADPSLGAAYSFIAMLYEQTRNCGASELENQSVYWAAVDKYQKAMSVDPSLREECQNRITYLTSFFPTTEQVFFQDKQKGDAFKVPCWINEMTTVRTRD
jgi:tetratricopeptide repeat protein